MNIKGFLSVALFLATVMSANAQKGVDNGTQFGSGEDSIRCLTNISLFIPYAKVNNFQDAYPYWKIAYDECPGYEGHLSLWCPHYELEDCAGERPGEAGCAHR